MSFYYYTISKLYIILYLNTPRIINEYMFRKQDIIANNYSTI